VSAEDLRTLSAGTSASALSRGAEARTAPVASPSAEAAERPPGRSLPWRRARGGRASGTSPQRAGSRGSTRRLRGASLGPARFHGSTVASPDAVATPRPVRELPTGRRNADSARPAASSVAGRTPSRRARSLRAFCGRAGADYHPGCRGAMGIAMPAGAHRQCHHRSRALQVIRLLLRGG
jgi:hypothetical protein